MNAPSVTAAPSPGPVERLFTATFSWLVLGHLLQALGYASAPLLPLYLEHLDANHTTIGLIMSTAAVSGLIFRPLVGWALDTMGRKPTIMVGTAVLVAGMAALGLVTDIGPTVYAARFLIGIGIGTLFTGYFTLASDHIPTSRRTEGIALFGISGLLPLMVNPLIQGSGVDGAALRWVFPGLAVLIALSFVALRFVPDEEPQASREPVRLSDVTRALRQPGLLPVWLAAIVFAALVATFLAFATVAAKHRGVDNPAMLWLTYALGACAVRLFGARIPDRVGPTNLIAPSLACYVAGLLMVAQGTSNQTFLVAGAIAGLGHGYCFPVLISQVVQRAPERLRGSALAMFTALWEVSALAFTPVLGYIADVSSDAVLFGSAALLAIAGLVAWLPLEYRAIHLATRRTAG